GPLARLLAAYGCAAGADTVDRLLKGSDGYAEGLLRHLGARDVHVFDVSAYEGATHLCDLNRPVDDALKGAYSAVLDGGSLEHVFNFPVAIRNCMEMVRVGGHFLAITPANNFMGHGFYQFSPELFYNVLSEDNGYEIVRLLVCEVRRGGRWYAVRDPRILRKRVTLTNSVPVHMLVVARRKAAVPIFRETPQQSDYRVVWGKHDTAPGALRAAPPKPPSWRRKTRRWIKSSARRLRSPFDARFFEPIDLDRLNRGGR
ncbi:MAG TPA: hypothetical protein VFB95_02035, partial [Candidatus Cryosericum sp.]|nr:hypothetical protein [Candidatus Cryosericum sp.]